MPQGTHHSAGDGHLAGFQFGATVHSTTMDVLLHLFWWARALFSTGHTLKSGIAVS